MIEAKNKYLEKQMNKNKDNHTDAKDCNEQEDEDPKLLDSTRHMG